jgi:hypothetical protein
MPRYAVRISLSLQILVALGAALAVACGDDSTAAPDSGSMVHPMDAAMDAQVDADAEVEAGMMDGGDAAGPSQGWDGSSGLGNLTGEICVLEVPAQCDGAEDCAPGECCAARFEPKSVSFTAMECTKRCDFQRTFPLCHAGQLCSATGDLECRTSVLLPNDSIGICALKIGGSQPTGDDVSGEINCGAERCTVGTEQCCLRKGFDFDSFQSVPYEPYCAPIGAPCECDQAPPPRPDAAVPDEDAGAD